MGIRLSIVALVAIIGAFFAMFSSDPERPNYTVSTLERRITQSGDIIHVEGEGEGDRGERDSGEGENSDPAPPHSVAIVERINTFLQTNIAGSRRLNPTVWPTRREFNDAKERFGYIPENLHFAVTGTAGCGKSTLVNSLRGLRPSEDGAAKTGVNETTTEAARYPHFDRESPLARVVWYDIPGAGTQTTPGGSAYFNAQGLFIFDFIIVVTGDRFTEQDLDILANCRMYNIPSFVVRPKADTNIHNMASDEGYSYGDARMVYINSTRSHFREKLREAAETLDLDRDKEIFLVSKEPLRVYVKSLMDGEAPEYTEDMIDEEYLFTKLLIAAQMRRYPSRYGVGWSLLQDHNLRHAYVFPY